jgi:hypothetical protein
MKKVVIIPVFCEAHLVKFQIPNIIDTINPDYIIYNEGMFPRGPESSTIVNDNFLQKYTLDGYRGFDYDDMKDIVEDAKFKYPNTNIILNEMSYEGLSSAPECYFKACSNFSELGIEIEPGDYIFPYEGDVFHHQDSKVEIQGYLDQLTNDTGFTSNWIDFLETQYYCERSTLVPFLDNKEGRHRKVCIRFGTWDFYKDVLLNFMTQKYPMLSPTDLVTFHYAWWRPGKYKQLRFTQLQRPAIYWEQFETGLQQIKQNKNNIKTDVLIRPSREIGSIHRNATYFEIDHPKHIKSHPNWI